VIDAHMREQDGFDKCDSAHFDALLHGCIRDAAALDAALARHVDRRTSALSPVEHGVLLIGAWELSNCLEIPYKVAINEAIELAKANRTWTASDASDEQSEPDDFASALAAHPAAELHWRGFSASVRKGILYWIASAKRAETRARRIARTVELAEQNIRVMFDQP
jgi:hypothetical protein